MKKLLVIFFVLSIFLSACTKEKTNMDQPAQDGKYHYSNEDLGFSVVYPAEFIYYQTQRTNNDEFTDIEVFVPTNDTEYPQEIQSYAKPVMFRIFNQDVWEDLPEVNDNKKIYKVLGEKSSKVYTYRLWERVPADWQDRWSDEMGEEIIKSFQIK